MSLVALEVQRHGSYKGCGEKKREEKRERRRRGERKGKGGERRKRQGERGKKREKRKGKKRLGQGEHEWATIVPFEVMSPVARRPPTQPHVVEVQPLPDSTTRGTKASARGSWGALSI